MKLLLKRIARKPKYTIGRLYVDGKYLCDSIEDTDRKLTQDMPLSDIKKIKVQNETAIPTGTYNVTINIISPKFSKKSFYIKNADGGRVPRILNVKGFDGILIHCGQDQNSSSGCIIVGENKVVGKVVNSQDTFIKLYKILKNSTTPIQLTIE